MTSSLLRIIILLLCLSSYIDFVKASNPPIQWAWMGGSLTPLGVYGQQGVPSTSNIPGARELAALWYDSSTQELWIFGGDGFGSTSLQQGA